MEIPQNVQVGDVINLEVCTYEARDVEYAAECGDLVVPENRSDPDSRMLAPEITGIFTPFTIRNIRR
ncbi:hypothetical protein ACFLZW_04810 [Chloroflexota bacterium]